VLQASVSLSHPLRSFEFVSSSLRASEEHFHNLFESIFSLRQKGYDDEHIAFARQALADMLGSVGYSIVIVILESLTICVEAISMEKVFNYLLRVGKLKFAALNP
jgi:hypothetical protein